MVVAYHIMWTVYGFWFPNDPRGSTSTELRVERLADLGDIHFGRKQQQPSRGELREFFAEGQPMLAHPVLELSDEAIQVVATSFGDLICNEGYVCWACAIMPDHVHLVIRRHRDQAEVMIDKLQLASRDALIAKDLRSPTHPVWTKKGWKVFLNTRRDIETRVRYVENNPVKAGRPRQHWPFVTKYDGWLPKPAYQ